MLGRDGSEGDEVRGFLTFKFSKCNKPCHVHRSLCCQANYQVIGVFENLYVGMLEGHSRLFLVLQQFIVVLCRNRWAQTFESGYHVMQKLPTLYGSVLMDPLAKFIS